MGHLGSGQFAGMRQETLFTVNIFAIGVRLFHHDIGKRHYKESNSLYLCWNQANLFYIPNSGKQLWLKIQKLCFQY